MRELTALIAQLDKHQPHWWLRFASQTDLIELVSFADAIDGSPRTPWAHKKQAHKERLAMRLQVVLRAALAANLIQLPEGK